MADEQRMSEYSPRGGNRADRKEHDAQERNQDNRRRSRSPRREKPHRKDAGFKWKERKRDDDDRRDDRDRGLNRGYKDHYRPRSRSRSPRRESPAPKDVDRGSKMAQPEPRQAEKKEKREKKRPAPAMPQEPMIIVYVNDRLGTKKAIPCFATDPVSE